MTQFTFDKAHSNMNFKIKHLMVSTAKGEFEDFNVDVQGDINDLSTLKFDVDVNVDSINTSNADRDAHLKNEDFFKTSEHPKMTFTTKEVEVDGDELKVKGDFTLLGHTQEEVIEVEYNGQSKDPMAGNTITGFDFEGEINREDYGLNFNAPLETGGVMLGKKVKFHGSLEFQISE
ncbi:YceI family protein [Abyssicoccus albus]|uniref:YceI family protein n=1 Tax=Abyssicoccus albus TaxID=1817405 RepID=UPI00097E2385|nr:YceI family protein [Abyssicoccus albus]AQL56812.1 hypothetical protein BVH56_07750 [Abyssicoccus albus]